MIRVYGLRQNLDPIKAKLSDVINTCMVDALSFPTDKRAHRFIPMDAEDFYYPEGRTDAYTVIEISLMEGRSAEVRKKLIHLLFERIGEIMGIAPIDLVSRPRNMLPFIRRFIPSRCVAFARRPCPGRLSQAPCQPGDSAAEFRQSIFGTEHWRSRASRLLPAIGVSAA